MAALSRTDVEHVAHLARLGLNDDELARLEASSTTSSISTRSWPSSTPKHIPPTAQTIELENILRDDEVRPSLPQARDPRHGPQTSGEYFVVPPILGEHGN